MAISNGNCFICGKTAGKTAIKNHVLKDHNNGDEQCHLIKAEGAYDKNYWLFFTASHNSSLSTVDEFLRDIWCECCGHLSAFYSGGCEINKARKLSAIAVGDTLLYEYDFGSTTEIIITIIAEISRVKQKEKVQLLARNALQEEKCGQCDAPATEINVWEYDLYCGKCAEDTGDDTLMPIVNSPRSGVCGYDGGLDIWVFDPAKPFPQPSKLQKIKR
jgi:hypothetical protein